MRKYEKVKVTTEQNTIVEVTCDICGTHAKSWSWAKDIYEVNETEFSASIRHKEGSSYPEGGIGTEVRVDICPTCFKNKLIPWLQSQGVNINQEEWDW